MDVLIDTDPGLGTMGADPEDALALAFAFASPELTVRAVTCVHGNVPLRHAYANAAHLLALLGREDVVLAAGHEAPLVRGELHARWLAERDEWARAIPAWEPPYPSPRAVEVILEARTIIAIGPLTNLAAALRADPSLPDRLDRVVVMGGAFEVPGNVTPTAEFNFFADPLAARLVLDAGLQPVLVGLDVCHRTHLPSGARPRGALGEFLQHAAGPWLASDGPHLYDSLAVAAAIRPDLLTLEPALVRVERDGTSVAWLPGRPPAWSRPDRPDNALVATGVDAAAFGALFAERVL